MCAMAAVQPFVPRVLRYKFLPEGKVSDILRGIPESRLGKQKFHFIQRLKNPLYSAIACSVQPNTYPLKL